MLLAVSRAAVDGAGGIMVARCSVVLTDGTACVSVSL